MDEWVLVPRLTGHCSHRWYLHSVLGLATWRASAFLRLWGTLGVPWEPWIPSIRPRPRVPEMAQCLGYLSGRLWPWTDPVTCSWQTAALDAGIKAPELSRHIPSSKHISPDGVHESGRESDFVLAVLGLVGEGGLGWGAWRRIGAGPGHSTDLPGGQAWLVGVRLDPGLPL